MIIFERLSSPARKQQAERRWVRAGELRVGLQYMEDRQKNGAPSSDERRTSEGNA